MSTIHIHLHFPPTGDVPSPLFKQLKELMSMNQAELKNALTAIGDTLGKATDEIVLALNNLGQTSPEVDAAVERLRAAAKALDDLNPDPAAVAG